MAWRPFFGRFFTGNSSTFIDFSKAEQDSYFSRSNFYEAIVWCWNEPKIIEIRRSFLEILKFPRSWNLIEISTDSSEKVLWNTFCCQRNNVFWGFRYRWFRKWYRFSCPTKNRKFSKLPVYRFFTFFWLFMINHLRKHPYKHLWAFTKPTVTPLNFTVSDSSRS